MEKILTVVVPTYNMEDYLDRCLSSLIVREELMEVLEVLVVNDGSKDHSSEIAHSYEARFPETFKVIDKENGNYGSCINAALPVATGKYIKILDADDFVDTYGFNTFLDFLINEDADAVVTNTIDMDGNGNERGRKELPLNPSLTYRPDELGEDVLSRLFMHELTYRKDIFSRFHYHQTEGISFTDLEWAYYPMAVVECVRFCAADVYCYRQGREGQTVAANQRGKNMWMEEQVIRQMYERLDMSLSLSGTHSSNFMEIRLALYSVRIYFYYLLEYKGMFDEDNLIFFDSFIKETCPSIYERTGESECRLVSGSFKYIKSWRKRKTRKTMKFLLYDSYRWVSNVRHSLIGR